MKIEDLWRGLEAEATTSKAAASGWLLRLMKPAVDCHLFASLEVASRRRGVLLKIPRDFIPKRQHWPRCRGLEPLAVEVDGSAHFGVSLKEPRFTDVFSALVEDLARRVSEAETPAAQGQAFLGQLVRWHKFLSASQEGLSDEQQRGLWGELFVLREYLLLVLGASAVAGWKGGERAHQDFQFLTGAMEVKTTLAKQPQVVRITSERQLDDAATPVLFLMVIALDRQEGSGETLPSMVDSLRTALATDPAARERFEDALLAAAYLDVHATRYADHGYLVRSERLFRVGQGFPRIVESGLPEGIGDVNYGLSVAACQPHAVDVAELKAALI